VPLPVNVNVTAANATSTPAQWTLREVQTPLGVSALYRYVYKVLFVSVLLVLVPLVTLVVLSVFVIRALHRTTSYRMSLMRPRPATIISHSHRLPPAANALNAPPQPPNSATASTVSTQLPSTSTRFPASQPTAPCHAEGVPVVATAATRDAVREEDIELDNEEHQHHHQQQQQQEQQPQQADEPEHQATFVNGELTGDDHADDTPRRQSRFSISRFQVLQHGH